MRDTDGVGAMGWSGRGQPAQEDFADWQSEDAELWLSRQGAVDGTGRVSGPCPTRPLSLALQFTQLAPQGLCTHPEMTSSVRLLVLALPLLAPSQTTPQEDRSHAQPPTACPAHPQGGRAAQDGMHPGGLPDMLADAACCYRPVHRTDVRKPGLMPEPGAAHAQSEKRVQSFI